MLQYCDYIANRIRLTLHEAVHSGQSLGIEILSGVSKPSSDLHPTEGWLQSTNKTIEVVDKNGQKYKVTVEAVEE
jgi:hypothetical protein